jgi:hypothetical protein
MANIKSIALPGFYVTPFAKLEKTRYCLAFVTATINRAHQALLLIDTASSDTILTKSFADETGIECPDSVYSGHTVDDARSFRYQRATLDEFEVDNHLLRGFPVLVSERTIYYANSHYQYSGIKKIDGVLGADFLKRFVVSFDIPNRRIDFGAPGNGSCPKAKAVEVVVDRFAVVVEVEVAEGVIANFLLDTGAASTFFSPGLVSALDVGPGDTEVVPLRQARGIGGMVNQFVILRHDKVMVSGVEIPTEFVLVRDLDYSPVFGKTRIDGILGGHLLYNFRTTIDYAGKRLFLDRIA